MAYTDFGLSEAIQLLSLTPSRASLTATIPPREIPSWLKESLQRGQGVGFGSEKSRSEFIVAPILLSCRDLLQPNCALHSGIYLDVDADKGLRGECDFILARSPQLPILIAPLLVVVEAKKQDIEEGLGQCAAQMVAARKFNERQGKPRPHVYGCVTSAETWQFLRLENDNLVLDNDRIYLKEVEKIFGVLLAMLDEQV